MCEREYAIIKWHQVPRGGCVDSSEPWHHQDFTNCEGIWHAGTGRLSERWSCEQTGLIASSLSQLGDGAGGKKKRRDSGCCTYIPTQWHSFTLATSDTRYMKSSASARASWKTWTWSVIQVSDTEPLPQSCCSLYEHVCLAVSSHSSVTHCRPWSLTPCVCDSCRTPRVQLLLLGMKHIALMLDFYCVSCRGDEDITVIVWSCCPTHTTF